MSKIQASVPVTMHPLTSAWQHPLYGGLQDHPKMVVLGAEVMFFVLRTLCLLGKAPELISQTICSKILEAVDPPWGKYGSEVFPRAKGTLFGEDFKCLLTKSVE